MQTRAETETSNSPHPEALIGSQKPSQVSGLALSLALALAPTVTKELYCSLPRNVISERERRRRISKSCDRLRALLPHFDGRREDMATVLEMVVQFLQLAHALTPDSEQLSMNYKQISARYGASWCMRQDDVLQLTKASQVADIKPDPGIAASGVTLLKDPAPCGMLAMDQSEAVRRASELLEKPPSSPEPSSLGPGPLLWLPRSWQSTSPEMRELVAGGLCQAAPLAREEESLGSLAEEATVGVTPEPDIRYPAEAMAVKDELSFLLTTSPDWWVGSVEGREDPVLSRNSPVDRTEPGFLMDPEPSSQEFSLEPWDLDLGSWGLPLNDEDDSIFPDLLT
uniref:spermatogenesis- and oogenesis-specific basic helix-loop-helix-containing protein 1 n=1 Tax=Jaculus jaculus TaxID=51337 RepID=UPI001E1B46A7|nr:spermatogenesis- and oogenesis-specific basic helix-loop-helix-containing protein 1 [Jaculus jaculus]